MIDTLPQNLRDMRNVASILHSALGNRLETGLLRGKTRMRNVLVDRVGCSEMEAELAVEQLQRMSYLELETPSGGKPVWTIHREPRWLN